MKWIAFNKFKCSIFLIGLLTVPIVHAQTKHEGSTHTAVQTPALQDTKKDHAGMNIIKSSTPNILVIDPARLQSIGVTYEPARIQSMEKIIRTSGYIEADERLIAHIHVKFDGWIERLMVSSMGEIVKSGQPLFTVYSPDLVSTQQEYLLALQAQKILGTNASTGQAIKGAQDALQAATQRLLLWGVSEKEIQQLKQTGKILKAMTIDSPIQGTVMSKSIYAGMRIEPGNELYTIADLSRVWIIGDIYEYELPYVRLGQIATVALTYLPNKTITAKLDFIYPTVDSQTRTIKARFEADNQQGQLKPGMYANLELKIPLGKHLVVPQNAILLTGEQAIIFIYKGEGKIEWRNVKLGLHTGDLVEVIQGLEEGEQVITSANFLIDSESQLKAAMGGMQH
ncbi:MAG: efflux transporter periplasmic adaptor subunit [Gammaproteobacteria bacterium GWE2_42_36]|nr:MAG: efflux transporter periplasmic adaptor subunit [Gammaproteobacteria bacterium GWE2_42_36]